MRDLRQRQGYQYGTTLIETLIAASFFVVFSLAIYQLYAKVVELSARIRTRTVATQIASEQIEFIRNLQYSNIGTVAGIPSGVVEPVKIVTRGSTLFTITTTIRNIDLPADGTLGGTPGDLSPADNKLTIVAVSCTSCTIPVSVEFTTAIAPKSLETENGNGAMVIKVIDADGMPVPGATVLIQNTGVSPTVNFSDVTDSTGVLTIVDAEPSTEQYHITVSKAGYSTEQTYTPGAVGNPNPIKPHLTVAADTVSQGTFAIAPVGSVALSVESAQCAPITGVSGSLIGSKSIGTNPTVLKNTIAFTASAVSNLIGDIEWDSYSLSFSHPSYDLIGTNPVFPLSVAPGSSQNLRLILAPSAGGNRLVVATTSAGLPIAGATVQISGPSGSRSAVTGVGSHTQTDWSGGGGEQTYVDTATFAASDGGVDYTSTPGVISLGSIGAEYVASGELTSSTIDLGAPTTFEQLSWMPVTQQSGLGSTPVRFQLATNSDETTWDFKGPDGTSSTYYTASGTAISSAHTGDRYLRYRVLLSTTDATKTPSISDISFTYTSGCIPPGQVVFSGLNSGTYTITVPAFGVYAPKSQSVDLQGNLYESMELSIDAGGTTP